MSKIFEFMKPYSGMILCAALLLFTEAILALILPSYMANIVNDGVLPGHISVIWRNGLIMLLITLLSVFTALGAGFFTARTATGVANDLREAVFKKILRFSSAEVNRFSTSSLITRTTNDIMQVQSALTMAIRQFIYAPIIGIGGIIRALERSPSMTWIIALATITMVGAMVILFFVAFPKYKLIQVLIDRLNLVSRENLSGILVVRAFSTQSFEKKRFDKANKDLADTNLFVDQAFSFIMPTIMLILNITTALIVWVGARQVSAFQIDIGDIFAFLQYGLLIIFAFLMVAIMLVILPRAVVSAERIKEVLEAEGGVPYKNKPLPLPDDFKGEIEFKNVSFRYPDALESDDNVLNDISFSAKPGETTAIIGSTGSGKTSVFKLILRFFDVTGGAVLVDGIDIRDIHKEDLHNKVGYISQKAVLFTGTIRSNLLYADKNAADETLYDAAETAQSADFIKEKEDGYESNVAQGGSNFSGGQRQRLSIARALVKKAQIYLFDDSFSALDLKTDALLRQALKKKMKDCTIVIIAQRISSIMDADKIVVLDNGNIAGQGTHSELLKNCEVYKEIASSQLSDEEVNNGL
ncbi:MAG: ABC transporter ATP-binding protein/permease [Defluviitaleaceae bacterium]|nr:ABC transporter ATP-binding protein/permease [Defluviitaleaceae bacterium]